MPYGKNQKKSLLEMTKCNCAKFLPHNSISLTFWTIFFTENIRYPLNIFPVIGTWGTKYLNFMPCTFAKSYYQLVSIYIFNFLYITTYVLIVHCILSEHSCYCSVYIAALAPDLKAYFADVFSSFVLSLGEVYKESFPNRSSNIRKL